MERGEGGRFMCCSIIMDDFHRYDLQKKIRVVSTDDLLGAKKISGCVADQTNNVRREMEPYMFF